MKSISVYGVDRSGSPKDDMASGTSKLVLPSRIACGSVSPDSTGSLSQGLRACNIEALSTVHRAGRLASVPSTKRVTLSDWSVTSGLLNPTTTFFEMIAKLVSRMGAMQPPEGSYGANAVSEASGLTNSGGGHLHLMVSSVVPGTVWTVQAPGA
eukprot:7384218-Prymnesium_polylepis.4